MRRRGFGGWLTAFGLVHAFHGHAVSADCNQNGVPDEQDLEPRSIAFSAGLGVVTAKLQEGLLSLDVDGDRDLDLVMGHHIKRTLTVLINAGNGAFESVDGPTLDPGGSGKNIVSGDFDGDSILDLVVTQARVWRIDFLHGLPGGGFEHWRYLERDIRLPVRSVPLDLDGDGKLDLAVLAEEVGEGSWIFTYRNRGGGELELLDSFEAPRKVAVDLTVGDWNGDGRADVAALLAKRMEFDFPSEVAVLLNVPGGSGKLAAPVASAIESEPLANAGSEPQSILAADLDGDRRSEIVLTSRPREASREILVLRHAGAGGLELMGRYLTGPALIESVDAGDADGDGDADLVATGTGFYDPWRGTQALLNRGDGTFPSAITARAFGPRARFADLNGDGVSDIAVTSADNSLDRGGQTPVTILFGQRASVEADCNRNGVPDSCDLRRGDCNQNGIPDDCDAAPPPLSFTSLQELGAGSSAATVRELDFDRDGDLDLAVSTSLPTEEGSRASVMLFSNDGGGQFLAHTRLAGKAVSYFAYLLASDFTGDGWPDFVAVGGEARNDLLLFKNAGNGSFEDVATVAALSTPTTSPGALAAADMNGDGASDVVALELAAGQSGLRIILGGNGRAFGSLETVPVENAAGPLLADFDGDGRIDVAIGGQYLSIFTNDGDGLLSSRSQVPLGPAPGEFVFSVAAADVDGDGDPDLAVALHGQVHLLLNLRRWLFTPWRTLPESFTQGQIQTTDVNLDSLADFFAVSDPLDCGVASGLQVILGSPSGLDPPFQAARLRGLRRQKPRNPSGNTLVSGDWNGDGLGDLAILGSNISGKSELRVLQRDITSLPIDCNRNGVPDNCEPDCNSDGVPDSCELEEGVSADCDRNGVPDSCQTDCDRNGVADACELISGVGTDCDGDLVIDTCELAQRDLNSNGVLDACDIARGTSRDCNSNGIPDELEIQADVRLRSREAHPFSPGTVGAVADFHGEGSLELVQLSYEPCCAATRNTVAWLKATRERFGLTQQIDLGTTPRFVEVGDFNQDGRLDAVVWGESQSCVSNNELAVIRGAADGQLQFDRRRLNLRAVTALAAGDPNGDGRSDLMLAAPEGESQTRVHLLEGDGRAGFRGLEPIPLDVLETCLVATDLDGDGDIDLALASAWGSAGVIILFNSGSGSFPAQTRIGFATNVLSLTAADVNGDGLADLALENVVISVLRNLGDRVFEWDEPVDLEVEPQRDSSVSFTRRALVQDIDGDGDVDLASAGHLRAHGQLGPSGAVSVRWNDGGVFRKPSFAPADPTAKLLGAGRWEAVGQPAILVLEESGASFCHFKPNGTLDQPERRHIPERASSVAAVDWSGDGAPDIAIASPFQLTLLTSQPGTEAREETVPAGANPFLVLAADLDRDGDPDLTTANSLNQEGLPDTVTVFLNEDGTLAAPHHFAAGRGPVALLVGDVDRNPGVDIVTVNTAPADVMLLRNLGAGTFAASKSTLLDGLPSRASIADLDGDHDLDIVVSVATEIAENRAGTALLLLLNDGKGDFPETLRRAFPFGTTSLDAADFNADGSVELLLAAQSNEPLGFQDRVLLLRKDAGALFSGDPVVLVASLTGGRPTLDCKAIDLDGDGLLDLSMLRAGLLVTARATSGLRFAPSRFYPTGSAEAGAVSHIDVDADRDPDFVLALPDGRLTFILNESGAMSRDLDRDGAPDECAAEPAFVRGDANGDSRHDIADAVLLLRALFLGRSGPSCADAADANDDGKLDLTDPIRILGRLFLGEPLLPPPSVNCGADGTPDQLGCDAFAACAG